MADNKKVTEVNKSMNSCTFDTTDNPQRKDYLPTEYYKGMNHYLQLNSHQI